MFQKQNVEIPNLLAKKKKSNWKLKVVVMLIIFSGLVFGGYKAIEKTTQFFAKNTILFSKPVVVKFSKPMEIITIEELNRREAEKKMIEEASNKALELIMNPAEYKNDCKATSQINASEFFERIRANESTNGKNNQDPTALHMYCRAKGMWNEIGYNPQNKFCFKDRQEAELYVSYYVKKNCDGKTMSQCLCFWNTGTMADSCAYSEGKLSLAN